MAYLTTFPLAGRPLPMFLHFTEDSTSPEQIEGHLPEKVINAVLDKPGKPWSAGNKGYQDILHVVVKDTSGMKIRGVLRGSRFIWALVSFPLTRLKDGVARVRQDSD